MKTIIAGSRDITDYDIVVQAIRDCGWDVTEVVCGMAKGVDSLGKQYAEENNLPIHYFPADWTKHGKAAGVLRNRQMAENSEALIAVWDGESRGTKNMIDTAKKLNLIVYVHSLKPERNLFTL